MAFMARLTNEQTLVALAQAVRDACVQTALEHGEDARMAGLCWEGAWEAAITAMRTLDIEQIVSSYELVEPTPQDQDQ